MLTDRLLSVVEGQIQPQSMTLGAGFATLPCELTHLQLLQGHLPRGRLFFLELILRIKLVKIEVVHIVPIFLGVVGLARTGLRLVEASLLFDLHEALLVVQSVHYLFLCRLFFVFLDAAQAGLLDHELEVFYQFLLDVLVLEL